MTLEKEHFHIRPSQVTRTFGPGAIYDNQRDSMIIMGLDYWNPEKFKSIKDEILLQEIKRNGFDGVERLISTSSFKDPKKPGKVPVRSFPSWGFCPRCNKLVPRRNNKTGRGMICDSDECSEIKKARGTEPPKTYPVRFVAACKNGHMDEFPWYRWIHRTKSERNACSQDNAKLYLVGNPKSLSLESKTVHCRGKKCIARSQKMTKALSKNGLHFITFGCTMKRPWLDRDSSNCNENMKGIFKGATNAYFPLVRSTVTIPPFSDDLAGKIVDAGKEISSFRQNSPYDFYKQWLVLKFQLKSEKFPDGRWTLKQVLDKIVSIEEFSNRNKDKDVYKLEFDALNSGENFNDAEFVTENIDDISSAFKNYIDRIVLVKKTRVVSAITGFTRIDPFDTSEDTKVSSLSKERLTWLPVVENRGEGIFFSINNKKLEEWCTNGSVKERFNQIMTVQNEIKTDPNNPQHSAKYVFLHTFSHIIIKSLSKLAGYSTASFTERIYCGDGMAGILIYTSSPSSDGALGGLVELGRKNENKLWGVLEDAIYQSILCSCDPLCSMQETERTPQIIGASCHACTLLPETCCENMNTLLDRELVDNTLKDTKIGFINL